MMYKNMRITLLRALCEGLESISEICRNVYQHSQFVDDVKKMRFVPKTFIHIVGGNNILDEH